MTSGDIYIGQRVSDNQDVVELARHLDQETWGDMGDQEILNALAADDESQGSGVICSLRVPFALIGEREYEPIGYDYTDKTVELVVRAHVSSDFPLCDDNKNTEGIVGIKMTSQFVPFLFDATDRGTQYGRPNPFRLDMDAFRKVCNYVQQQFAWFDAGVYMMDTDYS